MEQIPGVPVGISALNPNLQTVGERFLADTFNFEVAEYLIAKELSAIDASFGAI